MNRSSTVTLVLVATCLGGWPVAGPRAATAQQSGLERATSELPPEAGRALEQAIAQARGRGLPTEPLVSKALEGLAKGVPAQLILSAVRQYGEQLGRAHALLAGARPDGTPVSPADVTATVDALRRGVPEDALRRLRAASEPGEPIAMAAVTLGDLLQGGVPVDVALDLMRAWRSRGANAAQLGDLPAAVERLIRQGLLPARAAAAVASAMRAGHPPNGASPLPGIGPPGVSGPPGIGPGPPTGVPIPPGAGPPTGRDPGTTGKPGGSGAT